MAVLDLTLTLTQALMAVLDLTLTLTQALMAVLDLTLTLTQALMAVLDLRGGEVHEGPAPPQHLPPHLPLTTVVLSANPLGLEGGRSLAAALVRNKQLSTLQLADCALGEVAVMGAWPAVSNSLLPL
jgi:hypothetical protein